MDIFYFEVKKYFFILKSDFLNFSKLKKKESYFLIAMFKPSRRWRDQALPHNMGAPRRSVACVRQNRRSYQSQLRAPPCRQHKRIREHLLCRVIGTALLFHKDVVGDALGMNHCPWWSFCQGIKSIHYGGSQLSI